MVPRRRVVDSLDALLAPFPPGVNALCFTRALPTAPGPFEVIAEAFAAQAEDEGGVTQLTLEAVAALPHVDPRALQVLEQDLRWLGDLGRDPQLNVITRYPRDDRGLPVQVDVHSFHADRAPVETDTFLCTYAGAPSEGLDNDDASRWVDDPHVRAALRAVHGRDEGFDDFLKEGCFDLHSRPAPGASPWRFGVGALWRISVAWPGATVPPCLHRAPLPDGRPRLLLIS